jgi:ABC-2 type transport system ATP-binding protein
VRRLNRKLGMTIFLTTQYLEEADELADIVAIIDAGKIVAQGSPAELKVSVGNESINLKFGSHAAAEKALRELNDLSKNAQVDRDALRLYMKNAAESVPMVVNRLQQIDLNPLSLTLTQPTLDDVFLQVTGQRLSTQENVPELEV